jgi:hypothetical protein
MPYSFSGPSRNRGVLAFTFRPSSILVLNRGDQAATFVASITLSANAMY